MNTTLANGAARGAPAIQSDDPWGEPAPKPQVKAKPIHVLVVDDSRATRLVLKNMVHEFGYEVTEATNGAEALNCLRTGAPVDLVFLDWDMPIMNGLEFVQSVRKRPEYEHIPILMITGLNSQARVLEALEAGVNEYIMKPFTKEIIELKLSLVRVGGTAAG